MRRAINLIGIDKVLELSKATAVKTNKGMIHLDEGVSTNHKEENLRMLCPNCHSQTHTYAGKKRN